MEALLLAAMRGDKGDPNLAKARPAPFGNPNNNQTKARPAPFGKMPGTQRRGTDAREWFDNEDAPGTNADSNAPKPLASFDLYKDTVDFCEKTYLPPIPPCPKDPEDDGNCWTACKKLEAIREKNCDVIRQRVAAYMKMQGCPSVIRAYRKTNTCGGTSIPRATTATRSCGAGGCR